MASDKMLGSFDQKTSPEDNDLLVEYDASVSKVKNVKFGGVWNWIVKKLTSAVISELQTSNQSVVGAINELNSKRICSSKSTIHVHIELYQSALIFGSINTNAACLYMITRLYDNTIGIATVIGPKNHGITGVYNSNTNLVDISLTSNNSYIILC